MTDSIPFEPFADFILIRPIKRGQTTGGLALPDGADPEPMKGEVVKSGPGRPTEFNGEVIPNPVQVGDLVYLHFAYNKPVEMTIGGTVYLISRARDVMGRIPA